MTTTRAYPPDFCDEETMAYCLGLAASTLREYVAAGIVPKPVKIGNKSRWHRLSVVEALAAHNDATRNPLPGILEAARGHGETKRARRNAA